jgi:hypothetical protein
MGKTQEVKRLRFAGTTISSIMFRKAAKLDNPRLIGMQLKPKPHKSLAQFRQKPLCFLSMLKASNKVISKANEDYLSVRLLPPPSLDPEVENIMEIDIRQQRADTPALNRPYLALCSTDFTNHP